MTEIERLRMILREIVARASRHKRTTEGWQRMYLRADLEFCELEAIEGLERLARIERGETA